MASYRVLIKPSAATEIEAIDGKRDRQRIVTRIRSLANDPRPSGCEKLAGARDRYRVRVGRFRIVYRFGPRRLIELLAIGPRRSIYEETLRLLRRERRL